MGLPTTDGRPHRLTGALCNNLPGGQPTDASKTPYHDPHGTHTKWLKRHTPHRTTNPLPHGGITRGLGYIWDSTELYPPTAHTMSLMCQGVLIEAPKSGSKAYRNTRIWQNHMPQYVFEAEHARVPKPSSRPIEVALEANGLSTWSTRPTPPHPKGERYPAKRTHSQGSRSRIYMGTHQPDTSPLRVYNGLPGKGMLYVANLPSTPSTEVREALIIYRL